MTHPSLNYETPPPHQSSSLRIVTWIILLILGCFLTLAGACATTGIVLVFDFYGRSTMLPPLEFWLSVVEAVVIVAATLGSGFMYIRSSLKVRRHTPGSARAALKWVLANLIFVLLLFLVNLAQSLPRGLRIDNLLIPAIFYGIGIATDCTLAYCLYGIMREPSYEDAS